MTNDFERRFKEHRKRIADNLEKFQGRFQVDAKDRRTIEQWIYDTVKDDFLDGDKTRLANKQTPYRRAEKLLKEIDICK